MGVRREMKTKQNFLCETNKQRNKQNQNKTETTQTNKTQTNKQINSKNLVNTTIIASEPLMEKNVFFVTCELHVCK